MKKMSAKLLWTCLFLLGSGTFSALPGATTKRAYEISLNELFTLDTLTVYNPLPAQCDSDPLITASNRRINIHQLQEGSIRWMALSRNMLKRWGGNLNFGDTVTLYAKDSAIDGIWVIQDTMHRRFKNRGDLLFHSVHRSSGRWTNVTLSKRKTHFTVEPEVYASK